MPLQSPAHGLICAEVLSDHATRPRPAATRAHSSECDSKRRRIALQPEQEEDSEGFNQGPMLGRLSCRSVSVEAREVELRKLLLTQSSAAQSTLALWDSTPLCTMTDKEMARTRDHGVALQIAASKTFEVSSRTCVLAVGIYDKFLAKTIRNSSSRQEASTDVAGHDLAEFFRMDAPLACFVLACKFVETFAPRLVDVASIDGADCRPSDVHSAEHFVLTCLGWDIDILTGTPPHPTPSLCPVSSSAQDSSWRARALRPVARIPCLTAALHMLEHRAGHLAQTSRVRDAGMRRGDQVESGGGH